MTERELPPWAIDTSYYAHTGKRLWNVLRYDPEHHGGEHKDKYRAVKSLDSFQEAVDFIFPKEGEPSA